MTADGSGRSLASRTSAASSAMCQGCGTGTAADVSRWGSAVLSCDGLQPEGLLGHLGRAMIRPTRSTGGRQMPPDGPADLPRSVAQSIAPHPTQSGPGRLQTDPRRVLILEGILGLTSVPHGHCPVS